MIGVMIFLIFSPFAIFATGFVIGTIYERARKELKRERTKHDS